MAKRFVIKDVKSVDEALMALLVREYPEGFEGETEFFTNAKGERVECVPLETEDTKYLIKLSASLEKQVEAFDLEEFENESDSNSFDADDNLED
ncbi:MAG: hypothetical protein ACPG3S_03250 [Schleiferiaceae bacterium]|jgi:hypothetical protein